MANWRPPGRANNENRHHRQESNLLDIPTSDASANRGNVFGDQYGRPASGHDIFLSEEEEEEETRDYYKDASVPASVYEDDFGDSENESPFLYEASETTPRRRSSRRSKITSPGTGNMRGLFDRVTGGTGHIDDGMELPLTSPSAQAAASSNSQRTPTTRGSGTFKLSNFKFGFGGSSVRSQPLGPRVIHLNDPPLNQSSKFISNHVSTAKYNFATFIPKFLLEQFSKYANLFFLFTAIIQQVPGVSPTNRWTTVGPLSVVLLVSAIKEIVEDVKRHSSDRELNRSPTHVLVRDTFERKRWVQLKVGDIIKVSSGEPIPADIVLITSSEPEGLCYIETANLDGETNLKIKQALPETVNMLNPHELMRMSGVVKTEQPNNSLYTFEGTITLDLGGGERELSLSPDQLVLRGAQLRNTPWVYGIVVFTGHETKLMRNATAAPIKRTALEKMINRQILYLFAILIVLSVTSSAGQVIVNHVKASEISYLGLSGINVVASFFLNLLTFWILYSNLVPISLFVTVELVKFCQAILISSDLDMYYAPSDTPAICRTSSLVEELGQIEYIFSDKTGTLTCNQMEFRQVSIAGVSYGEIVSDEKKPRADSNGEEDGMYDFKVLEQNLNNSRNGYAIHEFLTLLSTCHTVIPQRETEKTSHISYQASSPDEAALVEGVSRLGYVFTTRKPRSIAVEIKGDYVEYEVLNVLEFNSDRKRMSTILRLPNGSIKLYCKGADTVIFERLSRESQFVDRTVEHLEEFATEGLRTLCLAYRDISEVDYKRWSAIYEKASTTISNRAEELDKASELIEQNLFLLGATAIEDKLQVGVPETIHVLQSAGIKIWYILKSSTTTLMR